MRTVLRSTLIKDVRDFPVFEELFDRFFSLPCLLYTSGYGHYSLPKSHPYMRMNQISIFCPIFHKNIGKISLILLGGLVSANTWIS